MLGAVDLATLPQPALWGIGVAVVLVGLAIGFLAGRRSGRRAIALRLSALGARLGADHPPADDGRVETALTYLEQVTGAATEAVSETSAESIRLRRSLDTLPLGLVLCDESGTVVYRNEHADRLMTSRYGDAIAAQAVTELLIEAWKGGDAERVVDLYGPPRRTLHIRAALIDDGRRQLGVLAMIEDVSERRRLEEIRRDFIANVSHELKTPMGALGLLAETLLVERDQAVATRLAERIHLEAFRVSRIIDDLLDLSRLESEATPSREPVPAVLVMAESIERIRSASDQRGIELVFDEPEPTVIVFGDRRQLVSALSALLENGVAYSVEGGTVTLHATTSEETLGTSPDVAVDLEAGGDDAQGPAAPPPIVLRTVRIAVTDKGIGIPAKDLNRIFERFYRVDPGRARETGGTGLGLSIARHVAQNHGGRVEVESREGEGSTFTLVLPLHAQ
ncbi:MAG TPA: ATP-binding protein [Acidimicrobiales bacterium]|nr:ATP-binding protein [Acidimicrobiales bacterium]